MFKRKSIIILGIIIIALISLGNFIRHKYVLPILMYHSVSPYESTLEKLRVSPDTFERQMHFLKSHHYNVISLESLGNLIRQKKKIPPKTAVITLDDGYKDNYIYAFPILKKYNLPATVFIIVNEVARSQGDRLSWDEIKEMLNSGLISIGSHCLGPEPLTNIKSEEILRKEIFDSKKVLEAKLGTKINTFAYPEGRFNDKIKKLVSKAGYTVAVATSPGKKFSDNDLFALKRLRISENAANLFVFWVKLTGYYNFMREHRHK